MILVAGIGNIFFGDDGFGSEVARRLLCRIDSPAVHVEDFGIRGLDFAYALMDGYSDTIIIDAVQRGHEPGTIYIIEPDLDDLHTAPSAVDAHSMDPMHVLAAARSMGAQLQNIVLVGCEPETLVDLDLGRLGLSPRVTAAVEEAVLVVENLIQSMSLCTSFRSR